jgi:Ca2+/Na+ antiporter
MDPSSILNSFTGVVAVVMIFGLPIVTTALIAGLILSIAGKRHRERMKMIEQGMIPPPTRRRTGNFYALIITGAILLPFGLAILIPALLSHDGDIGGGLMFSLVGLSLIVVYAYLRMIRRKEGTPESPPTNSEPPAPGPRP